MTHKDIAVHFLHLCSSGEVLTAFAQYAHDAIIHHNPFFHKDISVLQQAMIDNAASFPHKVFSVIHSLEDHNFVAVHSKVKLAPETTGHILVHIFRFEQDKIIEIWDISQPIPENIVNEHGII